MIDELRSAISGVLPLRIDELEFNDPVVVLAGRSPSVAIVPMAADTQRRIHHVDRRH
jgi:hypothetical protein